MGAFLQRACTAWQERRGDLLVDTPPRRPLSHLILRTIPDRSQLRGHLQKPQPASCQVTTYMGSYHHLQGLWGPEDCMSRGALCGVLHCKATVVKMKCTHIMCVS